MFSLALRYLCGFACATHPSNRETPEWPPHPDRVFMALSAAYFETDQRPEERALLEWLESCPQPSIQAAAVTSEHAAVPVYVPVNGDRRNMKKPIMVMPDKRKRDKRYFPAVIPESDTVHLIWDVNLPIEHRPALERLCAKVGYVGDTSSLVQMWVEDNPPSPTLIPVPPQRFTQRLRVPCRGRLRDLEADYKRDNDAGEYQPRVFSWGHYRAPESPPTPILPGSAYRLLIFRREEGPVLDIMDTLAITDALRGAVMCYYPEQPPPEWVSGHAPDGLRSDRPHLGFIALPNVGNEYADGTLKGVGLAVPGNVPQTEVDRCLDGLFGSEEPRPAELAMGKLGVWQIVPEDSFRPLVALTEDTWCRPARVWVSTTPIVLNRYPKTDGDAEKNIADSCEHAGLPRPQEVVLLRASLFTGVPLARQFPALPSKFGKGQSLHTHALLIFAEPVRGPVILGAGRFRGYGLCRPYRNGGEA
ncbi:MAG: type I-U CRISPR-associated protein Csb2 [Chloroflexi bacterium]|nr:type I-U CRISPR-associated protein Csb2 [Chloroflexota bacterium]